MKTIVFTAQAFGFGPVSKMLAISENISGIRKIFFGSGVSYDLAKQHCFDSIHYVEQNESSRIISILSQCDLFINVMDFSISALAKLAGCPYVLVDSLLWFWPDLPAGIREADIYFCQNFFESIEYKINKYGLSNAHIIGPVISEDFRKNSRINQVIVNFGGMENPYVTVGKNSNYPFIILKNILPVLKQEFSHILVTGREKILKICRTIFPESKTLKFKMLNQKQMLEELYQSKAMFTAPGIQSFYDAADKLPIFCLPPQNNSNLRNLQLLIRHGAIKNYFQWDDLLPENTLNSSSFDRQEMDIVLKMIRLFENEKTIQHLFKKKVTAFLTDKANWSNLIKAQKKSLENLGENGTKTIIKHIHQILREQTCQYSINTG